MSILTADWNYLVATADTTANYREKYSKDLEILLKVFKYHNVYHILHPYNQEEFTFHCANCAPSRLDRLYLPPHLSTGLNSTTPLPGLADHWGKEARLKVDLARSQLPKKPQNTESEFSKFTLQNCHTSYKCTDHHIKQNISVHAP